MKILLNETSEIQRRIELLVTHGVGYYEPSDRYLKEKLSQEEEVFRSQDYSQYIPTEFFFPLSIS